MKASLVISVYRNTTDLKVILDALRFQTESDFEIIISEDGQSEEMARFIDNYSSEFPLMHLHQSDEGWQKNKALNKAIAAANSNYLIFIDGDCVLHHRFIEQHLRLARPAGIVAGKRIKLGPRSSQKLRELPLPEFEKNFLLKIPSLLRDGAKFAEEGIFINPRVH